MDGSNIFPSCILDYYLEGMEDILNEEILEEGADSCIYENIDLDCDNDFVAKDVTAVADADLLKLYEASSLESFYESDTDRLVVDGLPDTVREDRCEQRTEVEHLNLSGLNLRKVAYSHIDSVISVYHNNLRTLDMSNAYGIYDEECLLNLFKLDNVLPHIEHIDISYVEFETPRYNSNKEFARVLWETLAENVLNKMPNLNRFTAYGFPIRHTRHAAKIVAGGVNIEANTYSVTGAENILKAREGAGSIGASNLCHTWSRLVNRRSTLAVLDNGTCRNDMFLDSLVPPYIEVDVSSLDNGSLHYLARVSTEEAIMAFFPYFWARGRDIGKVLNDTERGVLKNLCDRASTDLSEEKFRTLSCQIEFFACTLLEECKPSTASDVRRIFGEGHKRVSILQNVRHIINKI